MSGTFAEFITWPNRQAIVLAELTPSQVQIGWTKTGGRTSVYQIAFDSFVARSLFPGGVYRRLEEVRENQNTSYTLVASVALVDSTASSYYLDTSAGVLYVHTSTGSSPDTFTVVQTFFTIFVSTTGVVLNQTDGDASTGIYYWPWLLEQLPTISQERPDLLFGITVSESGDVACTNGHQFFNTFVKTWSWKNKRVRLLAGGSYNGLTLPYSEYQPSTTMLIEDVAANEINATFKLKPRQGLLDQLLPVTPIFGANLGEGVSGTKKWIGYGRATMRPDLTDTTVSSGKWTVADAAYQTLFAVNSVVAIAKSNGARTTLALTTDYTVDLTNCTVTIVNATYAYANYDIEVDVTGKPDGAGSYLKTFAAITKDILTTFIGVTTAQLDLASFTQADIDGNQELSVWLKSPRTISSILQTSEDAFPSLARSVQGMLTQTLTGLWTVSIWSPSYTPSDVRSLRKQDFATFNPQPKVESIFGSTVVYYGYNPSRDEWQVATASDAKTQYVAETKDALPLYTYLVSANDAATVAQRYQLISGATAMEIEFEERGALLTRDIVGNKVLVTYDPAPDPSGAYNNVAFELMRLDRTFAPTFRVSGKLSDLQGIGAIIGHWMDSSAPDWSAATADQRSLSGFWSDSNGDISPGDTTTRNQRVWW